LKPNATSRGNRPEWSMWAWVSSTKSMVIRVEIEGVAIFDARFAPALKHAALHQKARPGRLHQIA